MFGCFECLYNKQNKEYKVTIILSEMEYYVAKVLISDISNNKYKSIPFTNVNNIECVQSIFDIWFDEGLYPNKNLETYLYNISNNNDRLEDHLQSITFNYIDGCMMPISYTMF